MLATPAVDNKSMGLVGQPAYLTSARAERDPVSKNSSQYLRNSIKTCSLATTNLEESTHNINYSKLDFPTLELGGKQFIVFIMNDTCWIILQM